MIVMAFVEGIDKNGEVPLFQGLRILGIPNEVRDYFANNWINAIKQEFSYHEKYLKFLNETKSIDPLHLWERAKYLGSFEE